MSLKDYARKRDFSATPEPRGKVKKAKPRKLTFVIQKHKATRLHYDLRLEMEGVLRSWAVPKGPSYDPREKRLAVQVEDHPLDYGDFEGTIPEGNYGAGTVIVWDKGTYELTDYEVPEPQTAWEQGKLHILFHGKKLKGVWILVRTRGRTSKDWLLFKKGDETANPDVDITAERPESVKSGKTIEQLEKSKGARQWHTPTEKQLEKLDIKSGKKEPMPRRIGMMLATLVEEAFDSPQWLFEIKYDGVRALAYKNGQNIRLLSRNDLEMKDRFPEVREALEEMPLNQAIFDGEIVALDENGLSSFQRLQPRMHLTRAADVEARMRDVPVHFVIFDLLYCNGYLLAEVPLWKRKEILQVILSNGNSPSAGRLIYSDHVEERGKAFFRAAADRHLEGIMAKERNSFYESRRSRQWLKIRCTLQQEFVVVGYTEPKGSRQYFGSLLLGLYDERKNLVFAGSSGGGFTISTLKEIYAKLKKLEVEKSPLSNPPRLREVHWVKPVLVAQVRFTEWTHDGMIRHPVFLGLREDKDPLNCVREKEQDSKRTVRLAEESATAKARKPAGMKKRSTRTRLGSEGQPEAKKTASGARRTEKSEAKKTDTASLKDPAKKSGVTTTRAKAGKTLTSRKAGSRSAVENEFHTEHEIAFSNLDKVLWPEDGYTKRDLISFYDRIAPIILPHLRDRPLNLERFPDGINGQSFYQKNTPDYFPEWIPRAKIYSPDTRRNVYYTICNDRDTLLYLANLACIPHNPWSSRVQSLDNPDFIVFDLDPEKAPFSMVQEVALKLHEYLEMIGLRAYPKTSGATGIHIFVPLQPEYTYEQARQFAELLGNIMVQRYPRLVTLERAVKNRTGKVYIDFLQNVRGKTVVGPYVLRPRTGAPASTPMTWREIGRKNLDPADYNMKTIFKRLDRTGDIFESVLVDKQSLVQAFGNLDRLVERAGLK
jgi:bifunctional non-homologous end joining protein LigD